MEKELKQRFACAVITILTILFIFMGPGLIRPTDEEIIKVFAHIYFEAVPEDYKILFPDKQYGKKEAKVYIEKKFSHMLSQGVMREGLVDDLVEEEGMISHIKRAHIKKQKLMLKHFKVEPIRHDHWTYIYGIDGIVVSENVEDGQCQNLSIKGQVILDKSGEVAKIDQVYMSHDMAKYFNPIWN